MSDVVAEDLEQEAPQKKGKKKLLVVLIGLAVLIGVGSFFAMRMLSSPAAAAPAEEPTPVEGEVLDVAEMTATLPGETPHLARVGFAVVLDAEADPAQVTPKFAFLKDAAVSELAESSADELTTPAGIEDLRDRLSERAAQVYPDGEVLRVVLTQLVVQ